MVINPFIILLLYDLKFQPVSDAAKHLDLRYYSWTLFMETADDGCISVSIIFDEVLFPTK
jgi:hypothetical protein